MNQASNNKQNNCDVSFVLTKHICCFLRFASDRHLHDSNEEQSEDSINVPLHDSQVLFTETGEWARAASQLINSLLDFCGR